MTATNAMKAVVPDDNNSPVREHDAAHVEHFRRWNLSATTTVGSYLVQTTGLVDSNPVTAPAAVVFPDFGAVSRASRR
jgi:hypothetical protein